MSQTGTGTNTGNGLAIAGIVLGVVSLFFLPIVLGPIGIILAAVSKSKKQSMSTIALVVSILGTVGGMILGAVVMAAIFGS